MRVALVAEAFLARTPFDSDSHVRSLAPAMARAGVEVEVFTGTRGSGIPPYCQRRTEVADHVGAVSTPGGGRSAAFGVTSVELEGASDVDRIAAAFGAFLDRERPDVCHFEHLHAFGVGLVREAKRRGIATLYCAADTWPAHDRTSLTLPDLSPFELGDGEAEARAIAAEALLEASDGDAGDDEAVRARLASWLHGPMNRGPEISALRAAREAVEARRAEKRVALSAVDRRFASSRLLSKELSAAVGRAFTFRAPGVDTALITAALAAATSRAAGTRFVYCGTTRRTSGIDTLLDAFETLRASDSLGVNMRAATDDGGATAEVAASAPVQLVLVIRPTDDARDDAVIARAESLGVDVRTDKDSRSSIAGATAIALAESDALVLPTLWGEVAPALARFALAMGRPVIASRMPGLIEAVPQAAGLFVASGDPKALAAAMENVAAGSGTGSSADSSASVDAGEPETASAQAGDSKPDRHHAITLGARAVHASGAKSVDDEVVEWLDTYDQMIAARASAERSRTRLDRPRPGGVAEAQAQLDELSRLSVAELFTRAQKGLGQLRRAFGVADSETELLSRVVARGGVARDRAEQDGIIRAEVARALGELRAARDAMHAEEAARARRVEDLQAVLSSFENEVVARGAAMAQAAQDLESSRALAEELGGKVTSLESERDELKDAVEKAQAERDALDTEAREARAMRERADEIAVQVERTKGALAEAEEERQRMAESVAQRESEIDALRERLGREPAPSERTSASSDNGQQADLESIEAYCSALERDVLALRRHDAWMMDQATVLIARLTSVAGRDAASGAPQSGGDADADEASFSDDLARGAASLDALVHELDWRRREMEAARSAGSSIRARFLTSPLAARVRRWDEGPPTAPGSSIGSSMGGATRPDAESAGLPVEGTTPPAPLPSAESADGEDTSDGTVTAGAEAAGPPPGGGAPSRSAAGDRGGER